jgi:hypothetical protein
VNRKLTITVSEADIEASYRDMAADQAREKEALEWSEALIAESSNP